MNIALVLFILGIIMITYGIVGQMSPQCNDELTIKILPRQVYDDILYNQELVDAVYTDML
jgi:hypothetical protein